MDKKPLFGLEKKKLSFRVNSALQGEVFSLSLSLGSALSLLLTQEREKNVSDVTPS